MVEAVLAVGAVAGVETVGFGVARIAVVDVDVIEGGRADRQRWRGTGRHQVRRGLRADAQGRGADGGAVRGGAQHAGLGDDRHRGSLVDIRQHAVQCLAIGRQRRAGLVAVARDVAPSGQRLAILSRGQTQLYAQVLVGVVGRHGDLIAEAVVCPDDLVVGAGVETVARRRVEVLGTVELQLVTGLDQRSLGRGIVEAHGGTIVAQNSPLGGLRIRIELPLASFSGGKV